MTKFYITKETVHGLGEKWRTTQDGLDSGYYENSNSSLTLWILEQAQRMGIIFNGSIDWHFAEPVHTDIAHSDHYRNLMRLFDPRPSVNKGPMQIIIYENTAKRSQARRLSLKPGKAFVRILGDLPQPVRDELVDNYKRDFDASQYEVKWGESREDFKFAYLGHNYAPTHNLGVFTEWRKSLANSCMRHDFESDGIQAHPSEVYASGDFKIAYVLDKSCNKVAARSVVYCDKSKVPTPEMFYGPIYGSSDNAIDTLESEFENIGAVPARISQWEGAKILRIDQNMDSIVAPYFDCEPTRCRPTECGDYMELSDDGRTGLCSTAGYSTLRDDCVTCCECGARIDEDDAYSRNGDHYCDSCWCENFGVCECCEDWEPLEDLTTAYNSNYEAVDVCEYCRRTHFTECDVGEFSGEYIHDSCVVATGDGNSVSRRDIENDYFLSEYDDEYYLTQDMVDTENGPMTQEQAESSGFEELDFGEWGIPEPDDDDDDDQLKMTLTFVPNGRNLCCEALRPTEAGLQDWQGEMERALRQYPAIGVLNCADNPNGLKFYFMAQERQISPHINFGPFGGLNMEEVEFGTLAETIAAYHRVIN